MDDAQSSSGQPRRSERTRRQIRFGSDSSSVEGDEASPKRPAQSLRGRGIGRGGLMRSTRGRGRGRGQRHQSARGVTRLSQDDRLRLQQRMDERRAQLQERLTTISRVELENLVLELANRQPSLVFDISRLSQPSVPPTSQPSPSTAPPFCRCLRCRPMATLIEEKCCGHTPQQCLSRNLIIDNAILDPTILRIQRNLQNEIYGYHGAQEVDENHELRFAAYQQFVLWAHGRLGKGNRIVIPSCVVWRIRDTFPSISGQYISYVGGRS